MNFKAALVYMWSRSWALCLVPSWIGVLWLVVWGITQRQPDTKVLCDAAACVVLNLIGLVAAARITSNE